MQHERRERDNKTLIPRVSCSIYGTGIANKQSHDVQQKVRQADGHGSQERGRKRRSVKETLKWQEQEKNQTDVF